jgi:acyl carrier protein
MAEHDIFVAFTKILEEVAKVPASEVTPGADLTEDLHLDSLSVVEVIVSAEDRFSLRIPEEEVSRLKTVKDLVSYVWRAGRSDISA